MDATTVRLSQAELIDAWEAALRDDLELAASLSDEDWARPSPCPGWSAGDLVAHLADVESHVSGEPRPDHQPDWATLPHAAGDPFSEFTELGVDYRRGRSRAEVVQELRDRIPVRRAELDAVPDGGEVPGLMGEPVPLKRLLRMRTFDAWVHAQDIRAAVARDGGWGGPAALVAFQQMTRALPYVWGRNLKAPAGSTVRITITGPELEADLGAVVDPESGRGAECPPMDSPTVHLTVGWPDYMRLSCGRIDPDDPGLRERIHLVTDSDSGGLGEGLLRALSIAP